MIPARPDPARERDRAWTRLEWGLAIGLLLSACAGEAEPAPISLTDTVLTERAVTVDGLDAPPRRTIGFEGQEAIADDAVAFVPRFAGGAAFVDRRGRLYAVRPDGTRTMLAPDAVGPLVASRDRSELAYVARREARFALCVHDGEQVTTWADELASIGVLAFVEPTTVAFVGARPGGVAGVFVARPGGARCLTNCELITGQPFDGRFSPPPSDPASFRIEGEELVFEGSDGALERAPLGPIGAANPP